FSPDRTGARLLACASEQPLPKQEVQALSDWLPDAHVDQKREDALAMLEAMRHSLATDGSPMVANYAFEHTSLWDRVMVALDSVDDPESLVLDERRLEGESYWVARREVLQRMLALSGGVDKKVGMPDANISNRHGGAFGLRGGAELDRRLTKNHSNPGEVDRLIKEEARLRVLRYHTESLPEAIVNRQIIAQLRSTGDYKRLAERARHKQKLLASCGKPPSETALEGPQDLQLRNWYFEKRLRRQMPDDLGGYIANFGFTDLDHFHRTLLREFVYLSEEESAAVTK
ncbi:MAG: hypothetical protein ACE5MM_09175, partial [Nitrospiraceae bacterium]